MAKNNTETKTESKVDAYQVELLEKSENLDGATVLSVMNTDTLEKIGAMVSETIEVIGRVHLRIHNPYAENDTDYDSYIYLTENEAYYTGSESFDSSYRMIADNMEKLGITGNPKIQIIEKQSKNNAGTMLLAKAVV